MGNTAVLDRVPKQSKQMGPNRSEPDEDLSGGDLLPWSGELPRRLVAYLDRISPMDLRGLSAVVVAFPETRELANTTRLLHQVLHYGPHRTASGHWSFGEMITFKKDIIRSIRKIHRDIHQATRRGRIFMNSESDNRGQRPRHG